MILMKIYRYAKYDRARKDPAGVRKFEAQFIYRPKGQASYEEVFAHLNNLIPCRENAFLFQRAEPMGE